jgi:hypothetical protein
MTPTAAMEAVFRLVWNRYLPYPTFLDADENIKEAHY